MIMHLEERTKRAEAGDKETDETASTSDHLQRDPYTSTFVQTFLTNYNEVKQPEIIMTNNPPAVVGKRTFIVSVSSELPKNANVLQFLEVGGFYNGNIMTKLMTKVIHLLTLLVLSFRVHSGIEGGGGGINPTTLQYGYVI